MTNYKTSESPFTNVMTTYIVDIWDTPIHNPPVVAIFVTKLTAILRAPYLWPQKPEQYTDMETVDGAIRTGISRKSCYVKNLLTNTFFINVTIHS